MTEAQKGAISSPAEGLLVYQTDGTIGFYYYKGGSWTSISTATSIGSISSSSNNNGATITSGELSLAPADETNGGIVSNSAQTFAGKKTFADSAVAKGFRATDSLLTKGFRVTGTGRADSIYSRSITTDSINTKSSSSPLVFKQYRTELMRLATTGNLLVGTTTQVNAGDLISVKSTSSNTWPINGYAYSSGAAGVYGQVSANAGNSSYAAVLGEYRGGGDAAGVVGSYAGTGTGNYRPGVLGVIINNTTTGLTGSVGVQGVNYNTTGSQRMGVLGQVSAGAYGFSVYGLGTGGALMSGTTTDAAVVGWVGNNANYAGYFNGNHVIANGTKSASVGTTKGNQLLYCTESPEVWFEDMGSGKLVNGVCRIELDDLFKEVTAVDEMHPMHVFVQIITYAV
jgi:hypothetical protein